MNCDVKVNHFISFKFIVEFDLYDFVKGFGFRVCSIPYPHMPLL